MILGVSRARRQVDAACDNVGANRWHRYEAQLPNNLEIFSVSLESKNTILFFRFHKLGF